MSATPIRRPRLDAVLRRRHELEVIAVSGPAGSGRTTLLELALADGPPTADGRDVHLTAALASDEAEARIADALADTDHAVALVVDDLELLPPIVRSTIVALIDDRPAHVHLLVAATTVAAPGLTRLVAAGRAVHLTGDDLALTSAETEELAGSECARQLAPELAGWVIAVALARSGHLDQLTAYLRDELLPTLAAPEQQLLASLARLGATPDRVVDAIVDHLGSANIDRIVELPLVESSGGVVRVDHRWETATTRVLDRSEYRAALIVAAEATLMLGAVSRAGELAVAAADGATLRAVVQAALATVPPIVDLHQLQVWAHAEILAEGSPEADWLAGTIASHLAPSGASAVVPLQRAAAAFAASGSVAAELRVAFALGIIARRQNDIGALLDLIERVRTLVDEGRGGPTARALLALGDALAEQMRGDPHAALLALDRVERDALRGDWGAQVTMMRGTNLMLAGRFDDAVATLDDACGEGSPWSRAVAHDLRALARWNRSERDAAIDDYRTAIELADAAGADDVATLARAALACGLAAYGDAEADAIVARLAPRLGPVGEAGQLLVLAEALAAAGRGDLAAARRALDGLPAPTPRPVRSTILRATLESALLDDADARWSELAASSPPLVAARLAGHHGRNFITSGTPVAAPFDVWLPVAWCRPPTPVVAIRLLGRAELRRDRTPIDPPGWNRGRVRELCLHLALVDDVGRDRVAAALWPDLDATAALGNLRVNLKHLLDSIDPDRQRRAGSALVLDAHGRLALADDEGLIVDVRVAMNAARHIVEIPTEDRPAILSAARRLLRIPYGPMLGGAAIGEWFEPHRHRFEDLLLRALDRAGRLALAAGDPGLAAESAHRALTIDPWSESAHRLLVEARFEVGDRDGARRAFTALMGALDQLGLRLSPDSSAVAARLGFRADGRA